MEKELVKVCKEAGVNTEQIIYDDVLPTGSSIVLLETVPGQKVKKIDRYTRGNNTING